ncbi:MAG: MoaD/ThiS family protein [Burkholderiales bacterium]|nr:MoaD/ThiS family protein [Burkholderiales bacterium]MCL4687614.1 MoaD/ThiS family protein [Burkholderiales bacterium]
MKVFIPTPLRSYTGDRSEVEAAGTTLAEVMADLDRRFPGIRFRMVDEQDAIRRHIRVWVNKDEARSLDVPVKDTDEVIIFQALSGG